MATRVRSSIKLILRKERSVKIRLNMYFYEKFTRNY